MNQNLFRSFFLGGFECSTHRLPSGKRLDLINSTAHDQFCASDYRLLQQYRIAAGRDGLRWHLIETAPGHLNFSSLRPMLKAALDTDMQIIWDLWHYGWPDHIDIFSAAFVDRFTAFAKVAAQLISEFVAVPYISPINEISFFAWAGGEGGIFNPFARNRGNEMKQQLVRASISAIHAMREINPAIRFFQIDPIINVTARANHPEDQPQAEAYRQSQFEAWDMLSGRRDPQLGGSEAMLDVIGVNYYIHNQWTYPGGHGSMIVPSDPRYLHVRTMLQELHARYQRPLFIAETGIEDDTRPAWLRYMCNEVCAAIDAGVPVEGLCLYPILNHPGWDDDRHCYNGLFDYADAHGNREAYQPLIDELLTQSQLIDDIRDGRKPFIDRFDLSSSRLDFAAHIMENRTDEASVVDE